MEEQTAMTIQQHYILRDGMESEPDYSAEIGLQDFANDSPIFAYKALADHAARLGRYEQPDSNKRLAWLEDRQGKIVAEATVSATTILDNDFQKAIEDEEQAILQGELECNDEEARSMKP
ncbi:MAG TPA: hypothetical protein VGK14_04410 [Novimethylophilus sp.]|uniref:hypothetical protein n=1 Tax=Novimethylophilus sp. TaxID=2137426 RepID=UPI002F414084